MSQRTWISLLMILFCEILGDSVTSIEIDGLSEDWDWQEGSSEVKYITEQRTKWLVSWDEWNVYIGINSKFIGDENVVVMFVGRLETSSGILNY